MATKSPRPDRRPRLRATKLGAFCAALILLAGCNGAPEPEPPGELRPTARAVDAAQADSRPELALFTSLPILFGEGEIGDLLASDAAPHWARPALEERFRLVPLDRLTMLGRGEDAPRRLLMAQPRALAGDENVALDEWVRAGGRLLMLVDPMLDAHSRYGLGDRRRPEAMAMLSPILNRWGLELEYDPAQPDGVRMIAAPEPVPVEQAGRFAVHEGGHESDCTLRAAGLIARCRVGEGEVLLLADAALLAEGDHPIEGAEAALDRMMAEIFGTDRG